MVSALDYTRLLPSVQYVKNRSCSATITITIDHEGHQIKNTFEIQGKGQNNVDFLTKAFRFQQRKGCNDFC